MRLRDLYVDWTWFAVSLVSWIFIAFTLYSNGVDGIIVTIFAFGYGIGWQLSPLRWLRTR